MATPTFGMLSGMPQFIAKRQEQIFSDMLARVVSQGGLTDVTDSSGLLSVLQAIARQIDEAYYAASLLKACFSISQATGSDLDLRAGDIGNMTRRAAIAATGTVIFYRNAGSGTVTIDQGTQVQTDDGILFQTTQQATLTDANPPTIIGHATGQDSGAVPVVAVTAGVSGNVAAGAIDNLATRPTGVDGVSNVAATVGGQDQESDDAFRARILSYVASLGRGTKQSIVAAVLGAQDAASGRTITFASVIEDQSTPGVATLLIDDGTGQATTTATVSDELLTQGLDGPPPNTAVGGERNFFVAHPPVHPDEPFTLTSSTRGVLVEGRDYTLAPSYGKVVLSAGLSQSEALSATYTFYTGLIALAQRIVEGDPTDPANYPGYRAMGVAVNVRTPQAVTVNIDAVLTVSQGYDPASVESDVVTAMTGYVNALGIGQDILRASLIQAAMNVEGVLNVLLVSPATDVAVLDDQIARIAASNVTVS